MLYHSAAFISGKISEEEFLAQPYKLQLTSRLYLFKTMRPEYFKNPEFALIHYKKYLDMPLYKKALDPVADLFVKWRIEELEKKLKRARSSPT